MIAINNSSVWQKLINHQQQLTNLNISEQFLHDPKRTERFSLQAAGIFLDYSKNLITAETMQLLIELAEVANLITQRDAMFAGQPINHTEQRAVLHTALRNPTNEPAAIMPLIKQQLERVKICVEKIRSGVWRGYSGKNITDVVNIGIGGSDLGPAMVVAALQPYATKIRAHFVSNIDATHLCETLKKLSPETTLFIVASKTFTTQETLANAVTAREWLTNHAPNAQELIKQHFIAVTAKPERASDFGIATANIFPFWDWVGGRFSLWSTIGISIAITLGMENFIELLAGAHALDEHFCTAPLAQNLPVILALIGIWNINFWGATTQAVIPYDQYLALFPAYLQQLEMESNGKRVRHDGSVVAYSTAPVIWGSVGTNGQHAFHQLLMQGTQRIPVDFIAPLSSHNPIGDHQMLLLANCFAQSQALMCGRDAKAVLDELLVSGMDRGSAEKLVPHKIILGNVPSNTLLLEEITPKTLGALIALYEHKVFVQGVIWQINSFDQWGVELGKQLANKLIPLLQGEKSFAKLDGSTQGLIARYRVSIT